VSQRRKGTISGDCHWWSAQCHPAEESKINRTKEGAGPLEDRYPDIINIPEHRRRTTPILYDSVPCEVARSVKEKKKRRRTL